MEYSARFKIPYQESQSRLSILFRLPLALPAIVVNGILVGIVFASHFLAGFSILFFDHYPQRLFAFNLSCCRFVLRLSAYLFLLTDEYPSFSEAGGILIEVDYPDEDINLSRLLPLVKWLLVLPHSVILYLFYSLLFYLITPICWVVMVFIGCYPQGIFDIVSGVLRWRPRAHVYGSMLTTDQYPPFSLDE